MFCFLSCIRDVIVWVFLIKNSYLVIKKIPSQELFQIKSYTLRSFKLKPTLLKNISIHIINSLHVISLAENYKLPQIVT